MVKKCVSQKADSVNTYKFAIHSAVILDVKCIKRANHSRRRMKSKKLKNHRTNDIKVQYII